MSQLWENNEKQVPLLIGEAPEDSSAVMGGLQQCVS